MTLYHNKYIQPEEDEPIAEHVKGTQAGNFILTFFAETETLWSQGPVTRVFWKSFSIRLRGCWASDGMHSTYEQPGMRYVPRMLSIFWMMFLKWVVISSYDEHVRKLITRWLSMRGNWLLIGWACTEIGYSLTEHTRKLVTRWLSIHRNLFYWYWTMFFPLSSVLPSPFPILVLCLLFQVSVPCIPSSVPCLTSLFLVSHPLFPVLSSLFLVSHPLFLVWLLCSLFPTLCLSSSVPCLTSLFLDFLPL